MVYAKDGVTDQWSELGRTEVIMDADNPEFAKSFPVQWYFERTQWFRFECYDADDADADLSSHDYIGSNLKKSAKH